MADTEFFCGHSKGVLGAVDAAPPRRYDVTFAKELTRMERTGHSTASAIQAMRQRAGCHGDMREPGSGELADLIHSLNASASPSTRSSGKR